MRTISLSLCRDAAADSGDWRTVALTITADSRTVGWPPFIIRDLLLIAQAEDLSAIAITKIRTCLARLDATHD